MLQKQLHKRTYVGKVSCLDVKSQKLIAEGYGYIDISSLKLVASITSTVSGSFKLLIIIETTDGYISPFVIYNKTLFSGIPLDVSYSIRAYILWPINSNIALPLDLFSSICIIIQAQHTPDNIHTRVYSKGVSELLTRKAISTELCSSNYRQNIIVNAVSGYSINRLTDKMRDNFHSQLDTYINYRFVSVDRPFSFNNLGEILLAFKLYWLSNFDTTDCAIKSIQLGDSVSLHLADKYLRATSVNVSSYRSVLQISHQLYIDNLAKMSYFFLNPRRDKKLGSSSKIGLAFSRLIDFRFRDESDMLYMNITSLIFALQSLAEGIVEREIRKMNRKTKEQTNEGIRQTLAAIESIKERLPDDVYKFYMRPEKEVYALITRPTFIKSLEISLVKLDIDISEYRSMLKSMDIARRQFVHSEGYNVDFLLSLLTSTVTQLEVGEKNAYTPILIKEDSELSKLYELLRRMVSQYFEKYF